MHTHNPFSDKDYLDILYEGKNKDFGSYELRKRYPNRIRNAFVAIFFMLSLGLNVNFIYSGKIKKIIPEIIKTFDDPIVLTKIENHSNQAATPKNIKSNVKVENPVPTKVIPREDFRTMKIEKSPTVPEQKNIDDGTSNTNLADNSGNTGTDPNGSLIPSSNNIGTKIEVPKIEDKEAPEVDKTLIWEERLPEFPGGENAFRNFLDNNIVYPKMAIRLNKEGYVSIEFVVDAEGKISNIKVTRALGAGCDEEAIRVLKMMPNWKPGSQNGKKVPVIYKTKIQFVLEN